MDARLIAFSAMLAAAPPAARADESSSGQQGTYIPAVSLPLYQGPDGLPTGVQFMGRVYNENAILAVARTYQSLTAWHLRHPPELTP